MPEERIPPEAVEPMRDAVALMRYVSRGDIEAADAIFARYRDGDRDPNELLRAALITGARFAEMLGEARGDDVEQVFDEIARGLAGLDD